MAFIGKNDGIVGNKLEQGWRRLAWRTSSEVARIILNPIAHPSRLEHFKIEFCPLLEALRFEKLAFLFHLLEADDQLIFDPMDRLLQCGARRDVMRIGIDADLIHFARFLPSQRIKFGDRLEFFAKKGKPPSPIFEVSGMHF